MRMYVLPSSTVVRIDEEDAESPRVVCDTLVSDTKVEVLVRDYLGGELGIVVEDLKQGLWRLKTYPPSKLRRSHPPQRWV